MQILLINPPSLSMYSTFGLDLPPTGLMYVAAVLEQAGHGVVIKDLTTEGTLVLDEDIRDADLIGISSDTTRIDRALALAKRVTKFRRPVVMGGPHPQFLAHEIISTGFVDYIVKGEGESVLPALVSVLESGGKIYTVPGIYYRDGDNCRETVDADFPDPEYIPFPARHLLDLGRYGGSVAGRRAAPVVTSRGCPGACHFCSSSNFFGRKWRARSAESVLLEIDELYIRYGFRALAFMDDNFTLDPLRVEKIATGIIERGYDLKLWNFSRVDTIVNHPEMVRQMASAGSAFVYLGIESDNAETLNSLGKRSSIADVAEAVKILKDNNIEVYGSYIIGNLNEAPADIKRTVDMAIRLDTSVAQFSILTPYPGTLLYRKLKGLISVKKWRSFDGLHLVFRHPLIGRHHLQYLLLKSYIRFYRRSHQSVNGFRSTFNRAGYSIRKLALCAWELLV